jgi:hypothetical protein
MIDHSGAGPVARHDRFTGHCGVPFPRRRTVWTAERGGCLVADPVPWLYCSGQLGVGQQAALVEFLGVEAGGARRYWPPDWRRVSRGGGWLYGGRAPRSAAIAECAAFRPVPSGVSMIMSAACSRSAGASSLRTAIRAVLILRCCHLLDQGHHLRLEGRVGPVVARDRQTLRLDQHARWCGCAETGGRRAPPFRFRVDLSLPVALHFGAG